MEDASGEFVRFPSNFSSGFGELLRESLFCLDFPESEWRIPFIPEVSERIPLAVSVGLAFPLSELENEMDRVLIAMCTGARIE